MRIAYLFQNATADTAMKLGDWANIFQIFEAIVVAGSVLLILYQVWQQTKLAKANNSNTLFQLYAPFYTELMKDKEMAELVVEGYKKYDNDFDSVDQFRYRASLAWRLTLQENIRYQYLNKLLVEDTFKGWEGDFRFFIERRHVGWRWPELRRFYPPDFCAYVDKIIKEVEDDIAKRTEPRDKQESERHPH